MRIQAPSLAELPTLRSIESAAGTPFHGLGMAAVADAEPPSLAQLTEFLRAGLVLAAYEEPDGAAAADGTGQPLGFLLWKPVDGCTHVEQVSVHPQHAHRRIGRALIDRAEREGSPAPLTLTTFAEVPWNAPYYARLGFRTLTDAELTPGLREIRAHEATLGLDRWPRVCMRREADGAGSGT